MTNDAVCHVIREAVPRVTGKNMLLGDQFQNRLWLVVKNGIATDFMLWCQTWGIFQPLLDFLAALFHLDVRGAGDDAGQGQVVLPPKPPQGEE